MPRRPDPWAVSAGRAADADSSIALLLRARDGDEQEMAELDGTSFSAARAAVSWVWTRLIAEMGHV